MKKKEGWLYKYSESLKQNIALHEKTGWVFCEDGTKYSPKEIAEIKKTQKDTPKIIHDLKKLFEGEITKIEPAKQKPKKVETKQEEELEIW